MTRARFGGFPQSFGDEHDEGRLNRGTRPSWNHLPYLIAERFPALAHARAAHLLTSCGDGPSSNKCTFDSTMHSAGSDAATICLSSRK
jgi:hypothetical protein